MLIHPWDAATCEEWAAVLAVHDFGQLVTAGHVDGFPVIVPTHFLFDGSSTVVLHLARANPVWRALEQDARVVLAVATDWAYVEAAWNTADGGDPTTGVPTSYYTSVQLLGSATVLDDPEEKAAVLRGQLAHHEPGSSRLPPSVERVSDRRQLPGIRALRITVEAVRAKEKYGGNKDPEHRRRIAAGLAARGGPGDAAARTHLLRRLPPD
ncbi:MAG: FMN-binding negative transcriptional regulator [Marmoricola sp.]